MSRSVRWLGHRSVVEGIIALVMIALAFTAIASSDVSATSTRTFWSILVVLFAGISFLAAWMYSGRPVVWHSALAILVHWLGVFVAIQCVYLFVGTGRMANADTGLASGLILALGTFIGGAYGNWRLLIVGAALAGATVAVAYFEEYVWVFFGLALLAALALALGSRLHPQKNRAGA